MSSWVSQQDMLDFLDNLKHVAHPQYHVIDAVIDNLKEAVSEDDVLVDLVESAGGVEAERSEVVGVLRSWYALHAWSNRDDLLKEIAGATLLDRLKVASRNAQANEAQVFALQELCAAAGLINANDHKTDVLPLLRMFLPVE